MRNFFTSFPKHFVTAITNLIRHLAMTLSAASAVAVTLTLMALFILLAVNINGFANNVEKDLKIHVSIDSVATNKDIQHLQEEITAMPQVKTVDFSSSTHELAVLIKENGSIFGRYKKNNPLPSVFIVEVKQAKDIAGVTKKLNKMSGVDTAQYGGDSIETMIKVFGSLRVGGYVFMIGLAFIAIFLISTTIKMTIYSRKTEISIMRNVGASNWYIKTPFMIEGMFIGLIGASVPALVLGLCYVALYDTLHGVFLSSMLVLQKPYPFALLTCLALLGSGALVGIVGSFHAVNKYLRWSR